MRIFLVFLIGLAIAGGILTHRPKPQSTREPGAKPVSAPAAAATPREVSQHDWAKRSLDRVADVKRQVAQQQKENGTK